MIVSNSPTPAGSPVDVAATLTDPGSDDETFTWTWGDGLADAAVDRVNPPDDDPLPSPSIQPRDITTSADHTYDLIGVDAYRQPYIPFQLTTKEFFGAVAAHLNPGGVAVVNVGRTETDYRLVDVIASTMNAVYPFVYAVDVGRFNNTIVVGSFSPNGVANFVENAAALPLDSPLRTVADASLAAGNPRLIPPGGRVFTDDHAPVELVVDQIILDVAREGED